FLMCQQFDNAISDFDKFIQKNPKAMEAYLNRGSAYLMLKDTLRAYKDFNKAVEVTPRSSEALTRRGTILSMTNRTKESLADFDKAIFYDKENKIAFFNRALLYARDNKPMKAIDDFSSVIALDSINSLTYFNRAITKAQIGDFNSAMLDYDKVVELSPSNVLGYYNRAALAVRLGDLEKAVNDYSATIELYPDFANAYLARASVRYQLGDMVGSKRDKETADAKISTYQKKYKGAAGSEEFSIYADTSRNFNKILSFDSNFNANDKVKDKNVDIKLLALYRLIKTKDVSEAEKLENARDKNLLSFITGSGINNLIISNENVDMTREEILAEKNSRSMKGDGVTAPKVWKVMFEDAISSYSIKQYTSSISELTSAIENSPRNPFLYMNRSSIHCEMMEFVQSIGNSGQRFVIEA
ncbi:MAG: tetratricopeptide repeat protein, partial [Rikenellaceae bacterium]